MYSGNMYEFCQHLDDYLFKKYGCNLVLVSEKGNYYVSFFDRDSQDAVPYLVTDESDFEEQIYDYVNNELEYVQWQYDGLSDGSDGAFGEEI